MDINRKNYEVYFIDYFDGKLAPGETADLLIFLEQNPDLKEEFEDFESISLSAEDISYPNKHLLKRKVVKHTAGINSTNYEDYFIAYHEGDLSEDEKISLREFLALNPDLQKDFNLYRSLKLKANKAIIYPNKHKLKKKTAVFSLFNITSSAVAATLLVLMGYWFFLSSEKQPVRTAEPAVIARMTSIQPPVSAGQSGLMEKTQIPARKQVLQVYQREVTYQRETRTENADIFRMESLAMQESIKDNTLDAYMPRLIYQRFDQSLNQQEMYAQADLKEKTLAGKIISNAASSLASVFTRNVEEMQLDKVTNFNIWDIAEAGIAGYNALADREVVMFRELDENGRVASVAILGDNVDYRREFR